MGEESPPYSLDVPARARRPRAADPHRPDGAGLRRVRATQGGRWKGGLRGSARACDPPAGRPACPRGDPRALPGVHGRRVPGREPAPADVAGALARRTRRPMRRWRRLPVHLLVRRSNADTSPEGSRALLGRGGDPARGELPLHAGDSLAREQACARARRRREDAARDEAVGAPSRAHGSRGL